MKENNIKNYRITEYYRGSESFEKAFRFKAADNTDQVWGCRIRRKDMFKKSKSVEEI